MERAMGIEPTPEAWEASVLPLNYTRLYATPILLQNIIQNERVLC